jgi:hypothetical protein
MQDESVRVTGINIQNANALEKIESARQTFCMEYLFRVLSFDEVINLDCDLDNHLASLGGYKSMVLHTGGQASKSAQFSLVGSYVSAKELKRYVFDMDETSVNRGDYEFSDSYSFEQYMRLQIQRFFEINNIQHTSQDVEDAVNEFCLHDLWPKVFSSYSASREEGRRDVRLLDENGIKTRALAAHELVQQLLLQTLTTNIERDSKNRIVICSEHAKEMLDVFHGEDRYRLSDVQATELVSQIDNLIHPEIVRRRRNAAHLSDTNREMDEVITGLNVSSRTVLRLCGEQGIDPSSLRSIDYISLHSGLNAMSPEQIAQHDAEVHAKAKAADKAGGKVSMKEKFENKDGRIVSVHGHNMAKANHKTKT